MGCPPSQMSHEPHFLKNELDGGTQRLGALHDFYGIPVEGRDGRRGVRRGLTKGLTEGICEGAYGGDLRRGSRRGFTKGYTTELGGVPLEPWAHGGDLRRGSRRGFTNGYTTKLGGVPLELILLIILMCTGTS